MKEIDALERFRNPAAYLVNKAGVAIWHVIDQYTILYKTVGQDSPEIVITSKGDDHYYITITKPGKIYGSSWPEIINMKVELEEESKFHKIKRAVLHVPKPQFIKIIYDDKLKILRIYGEDGNEAYRLHDDGQTKVLNYKVHDSVKNYFHELVLQMIYA